MTDEQAVTPDQARRDRLRAANAKARQAVRDAGAKLHPQAAAAMAARPKAVGMTGSDAWSQGLPASANPHPACTREHELWWLSWVAAQGAAAS